MFKNSRRPLACFRGVYGVLLKRDCKATVSMCSLVLAGPGQCNGKKTLVLLTVSGELNLRSDRVWWLMAHGWSWISWHCCCCCSFISCPPKLPPWRTSITYPFYQCIFILKGTELFTLNSCTDLSDFQKKEMHNNNIKDYTFNINLAMGQKENPWGPQVLVYFSFY